MKKMLVMILSVVLVLSIMAQDKDNFKKISAKEAQEMQDSGDVTILDVRTKVEYNAGHIPGSVLLPLSDVKSEAQNILPNKDAVILVHCRTGGRSTSAAKKLAKLGYTNIYDFGGINKWKGEVVKEQKEEVTEEQNGDVLEEQREEEKEEE